MTTLWAATFFRSLTVIHALNSKYLAVIQPTAIVDNAAWTCVAIDTKGWDYAQFVFQLGATDIAMALLKLTESDDDSSYSDVANTTFGTSNNDTGSASTLPSATDDNKLFGFAVDCKARKRYLKLAATGGDGAAGAYAAAICILSRGEQGALTATQAGFSQRMVV
jgi:hypothetical protein